MNNPLSDLFVAFAYSCVAALSWLVAISKRLDKRTAKEKRKGAFRIQYSCAIGFLSYVVLEIYTCFRSILQRLIIIGLSAFLWQLREGSLQDAFRFRHESHHPSAVKHTPHSLRIPSIPGSGSPDWLGVVACTDGNDALVALLECDIWERPIRLCEDAFFSEYLLVIGILIRSGSPVHPTNGETLPVQSSIHKEGLYWECNALV